MYENQTRINCDVTESNVEEKELDFVKKIWGGKLDLPPGRPANQLIKVTFSLLINFVSSPPLVTMKDLQLFSGR